MKRKILPPGGIIKDFKIKTDPVEVAQFTMENKKRYPTAEIIEESEKLKMIQ